MRKAMIYILITDMLAMNCFPFSKKGELKVKKVFEINIEKTLDYKPIKPLELLTPKKVTKAPKKVQQGNSVEDTVAKLIVQDWNRPEYEAKRIAHTIVSVCKEYKWKYKFNIEPYELMGIISVESGFNLQVHSNMGAKGLMQITSVALDSVCQDWKESPKQFNMYSIVENVRIGAYIYGRNKAKYGRDVSLVAYNSGYKDTFNRTKASRGITYSYLNNVLRYMNYYKNKLKESGK